MTAFQDRTIGFLNFYVGGVGTEAGNQLARLRGADGSTYPMVAIHLDTDPSSRASADIAVRLQISGSDVAVMRANPSRFGPAATQIIGALADYLRPSDIQNGARTMRALTQLAWAYRRPRVLAAIRQAIDLLSRSRIHHIIPCILSSSGGGTGSACQILLMHELTNPSSVEPLLLGYRSDLLLPAVSFVVEPFAYARTVESQQARKIVANAYAFRIESDYLLRQLRAAGYVFHIGFSNAAGTVLSDPRLMSRVLGTSVFEIQRHWLDLKARWVDGPDAVALRTYYAGQDIPEHVYRRFGHTFSERKQP